MTDKQTIWTDTAVIIKAVRIDEDGKRQNRIWGWANVPHPVAKGVFTNLTGSTEEELDAIAQAYRADFPSTDQRFTSIAATFDDRVIAEISEDGKTSHLSIPFVFDEGVISFGEPSAVELEAVVKSAAIHEDATALRKAIDFLKRSSLSIVNKAQPKKDLQGDRIAMAELEEGAYKFVRKSRQGDVNHDESAVAELIESFFVTDEKLELMGITEEARAEVNKGWFLGFQLDDATMDRVESGELRMFSIGGSATRTITEE